MTTEQKYVEHVESCFKKAENLESKISQGIIDMEGMTGLKTRHFYNNLLSMDDARYFEIGVWQGSSSCAAMCGNKASVTMMDDFSSFGGPEEQFLKNLLKYKGENETLFIKHDCFTFDTSNFEHKFNIFLADGDHSADSHRRYLDHYVDCMDEVFIYVVDDYNWLSVREGTMEGIAKNNLTIIWQHMVRLTNDDTHTPAEEARASWHNGICVFILKQTQTN